jgi:hypothetical protein
VTTGVVLLPSARLIAPMPISGNSGILYESFSTKLVTHSNEKVVGFSSKAKLKISHDLDNIKKVNVQYFC